MARFDRPAVVFLACAALCACAPSGYSVQARNNLAQPVDLRIVAAKGDTVRTLENPQVAPGANITLHTKAERDEKVSMEARVAGEAQSPPAVFKMLVGLSRVVFNANPDAAKDPKQPKVTIREDRN